ncbi:hypothetical protein ACFPM7_18360 [Actinokineospora guangxiensis]|uniref:Uncharacterized protein n=1 Tax=Actinokineospora guangxiensis TaxID=1490288 RepID=A0ABW0ESC7_9PSEU
MGWLRRNRRAARTVTTGRNWPDAVLDAAVAEAVEGRLDAARTVLIECRAEPEIRVFRVGELAEALIGHGDDITGLAGANDPDLLLLAGAVFVQEAWAVRGSGRASTVGRQRFAVFHSHLARTIGPLRAAAELLPEDPVPWSELDPVARGLEFERAEKDDIWAELARRGRTLTVGVQCRLQTLAPKWDGDEAAMLAFARETVGLVPDGHPAIAVIADAVLEGAMHHDVSLARYARPHRDELVAASARFLAGPAALPETARAHNIFAVVFCALGQADHAAEHLRAMDDHLCSPWDHIGGERAYQAAAAKYL